MSLANLLKQPEAQFAPLCLDALTARLAEQAGFSIGYVSGGALGYAHAVSEALLTIDELADVVRHVTARSNLHIIVDGGVGFGDQVHLMRAVRQFEVAGAAAIEIEDQVSPKRVSHHRGIEHLIPQEQMVSKVKYACDARASDDFLIIARTGAVKNESFESACERANAYAEAGADMILLMPERAQEWSTVSEQVKAPLVTFGMLGARSKEAWSELGFSLVIDPFTAQVLAVEATQKAYQSFIQNGTTGRTAQELFGIYNKLDEIAGFDEFYQVEDATTEKREV
ncbi:MAG: isocitrate lyase/PEP mutase family protein [Pseudomonadota bacterium]